jgi:hypothetical protein
MASGPVVALLVAAGLPLAAIGPAGQKDADTSMAALVDAAAAYVRDYEQQLTSVVADEIYTQRIVSQAPRDPSMPASRHMKSEIFFMFAPADRDWMAIRDVAEVDGRPLPNRADLKEALRTLPAPEVAGTFKRYNSRFNLGRIVRNFNEPTLSLLVLDANHRSRFSFEQQRTARKQGVALVTLGFVEKAAPTLIRDLKQKPVFSRGELTIEAATGRVRHAVLSVRIETVLMTFTTTYAPEERLGVWVPSVFEERYIDHSGVTSGAVKRREEVACSAKYSNFRQFAVSTRIK